jgi:hypothetical protein
MLLQGVDDVSYDSHLSPTQRPCWHVQLPDLPQVAADVPDLIAIGVLRSRDQPLHVKFAPDVMRQVAQKLAARN